MAKSIREVMTKDPITFELSTSVLEAAQAMRDQDVGDVIVMEGDHIRGILTDRDITVRVVAEGKDVRSTNIGDCATLGVKTLTPDDSVGDAIRVMKEGAIRRIPIVENDRPVGIVVLGDLAENLDPDSVLGEVSEAPPNN